uniref:Uncharacterized protein n=1 Tax=Cacopsylla melanoneura TaxID=428564 RepID=A0A8D8LKM2_9HEMI
MLDVRRWIPQVCGKKQTGLLGRYCGLVNSYYVVCSRHIPRRSLASGHHAHVQRFLSCVICFSIELYNIGCSNIFQDVDYSHILSFPESFSWPWSRLILHCNCLLDVCIVC